MPNAPALALAISCVGRRLVLGARTEEEIEAALEALPHRSHQIGFYLRRNFSRRIRRVRTPQPDDDMTTIREVAP
jgi:hypothetical protein